MKKILLLTLSLSFLVSCGTATPENNDTMLTVEDTVIDTTNDGVTQENIEPGTDGDTVLDGNALDLSSTSFTGNGTEPFWGFNASGSTLVLREPSDTGPIDTTTFTEVIMTDLGASVNMTAPGMNLDLFLSTCSDGMSDIVYSYSSSFTAGATSYTGCANID